MTEPTPAFAEPQFPEVIDSSILAAAKACERLAYLQYVRGLAPQHLSIHLHAGATFARGLEVARRLYYNHNIPQDAALEAACVEMITQWGDYEPRFSWDDGGEREPKTLDRLIQALYHYFDTWPMATDHVQPLRGADGATVEYKFAIPLPLNHPVTGQPLIFGGRFDMIGEHEQHPGLWGVDEKTTKQLGDKWPEQWTLRGQYIGYTWACQQHGLQVQGFITRGLCFYKGYRYATAEAIKSYPAHLVENWYNSMISTVHDMLRAWRRGYWTYAFGDPCNAYGGCGFRDVCRAREPERWLEQYFTVRRWNPLDDTA